MTEAAPQTRPALTYEGKPALYIARRDGGVDVNCPLFKINFSLPESCYNRDAVTNSIAALGASRNGRVIDLEVVEELQGHESQTVNGNSKYPVPIETPNGEPIIYLHVKQGLVIAECPALGTAFFSDYDENFKDSFKTKIIEDSQAILEGVGNGVPQTKETIRFAERIAASDGNLSLVFIQNFDVRNP